MLTSGVKNENEKKKTNSHQLSLENCLVIRNIFANQYHHISLRNVKLPVAH